MTTKIAQPIFGLQTIPEIDAFDVLDLVAMPIHIINKDGQVLFVNKAWSSTYKVTRENAHLKPIEELMKDQLNYFMAIADPANMFDDNNTPKCKYNHLDKSLSESTAISAIKERKKVSMVTDAPDHSKLIVTSSPIFNTNGEIQYVMTVVQDLAKMSDWKERLDVEIEKNKVLAKKLAYYVDKYTTSSFVGQSKKITDIKEMLPMIAKTDAAVLILGESGVGKEVLAKEICEQSDRKDKPFITVNCAAIPDHLIESELFGYEKGAFTGAIKSKVGLMELANGGTILLDEIGSMPLNLQPKLLRVIQENELMRVGGLKKIPIDVRIISATNENLFSLIKTGGFRQDLYYRLNVIPIKIPPLRDRQDDIKLLCQKFLEEFNAKYNKEKFLNDRALFLLEQHDWPGNIRELKNAIERLVIIGEKNCINHTQVKYVTQPQAEIEGDLIYADNTVDDNKLPLKEAVASYEKHLIEAALKKHKTTYNAAVALGSNQSTIARKAKQYGLT